MSAFEVGQVVTLREHSRPRGTAREKKVEIIRVGRKWAYIKSPWGSERPFDKETGVEKDSGFGGPRSRIGTSEMFAAQDRRAAARARLSIATRDYWSWRDRLTAEEADTISDIVERAKER